MPKNDDMPVIIDRTGIDRWLARWLDRVIDRFYHEENHGSDTT